MYYLLSVVSGLLIAVMIAINGGLSGLHGVYESTLIIHIVGLLCIGAYLLAKREPLLPGKKLPFFLYLGGIIGVATTAFNNLAFGKISVSSILALGLLGQTIASLAIDHFGLFRMPKRALNGKKLIGGAFILGGIIVFLSV